MNECSQLDSLISEYRGIVQGNAPMRPSNLSPERLVRILSNEHDWTERGANEVVSLATEYGAFVLRNALALALALGIEDGAFGL